MAFRGTTTTRSTRSKLLRDCAALSWACRPQRESTSIWCFSAFAKHANIPDLISWTSCYPVKRTSTPMLKASENGKERIWAWRGHRCLCDTGRNFAAFYELLCPRIHPPARTGLGRKLSMIFAKIAFWEIVSAKINLGLECALCG